MAKTPEYEVYDYTKDFGIDTPKEERRRANVGDIFLNQAKCLECGDIIRSRNRHDYVMCSCGCLAVDGGSSYAKRSYRDGTRWEDMTVLYRDAKD